MNKRDYVGQWFEIYRRNNECADITFKIKSNAASELIKMPHEKFDGSGALFTLSKKFNWNIKNLATQSKLKKINLIKYFFNCLLFLYWTKPRKKNIWPFTFNKSFNNNSLSLSHIFSTEETQQITKNAKSSGTSLNTLIFYSLNKCLEKKFNWHQDFRSWWIPVNVRPEFDIDINDSNITSNYVSNFTIDVSPDMSLHSYQNLISESLKQKKHMATWWWQHLGKFLPEKLIEKIAIRNLQNNYYVGTFSNLGDWACDDTNSCLNFFVPTLKSHPVGAGAIVWNSKLSLTLTFHPEFQLSTTEANDLFQNWIRHLSYSI